MFLRRQTVEHPDRLHHLHRPPKRSCPAEPHHGPVKQAWDQVVCAVGLRQTELEAPKAQIHHLRETFDASLE